MKVVYFYIPIQLLHQQIFTVNKRLQVIELSISFNVLMAKKMTAISFKLNIFSI